VILFGVDRKRITNCLLKCTYINRKNNMILTRNAEVVPQNDNEVEVHVTINYASK
jgi:hypothetical protein